MLQRRSKVMELAEAVEQIPDGATVGIGGLGLENKPMAIIREMVRQGKRNLTVVFAAPSSIDGDILVGAGCADVVIASGLSLQRIAAIAPRFRALAQRGEGPRIVDASQGLIIAGLRGDRFGLPSQPTLAGVGTDFVPAAPDWFKTVADPFTGRPVTSVRSFGIDFALLHASFADASGHAQLTGAEFNDRLLAAASDRLIVSCESLVSEDTIRSRPSKTFTAPFRVSAIVPCRFGAHPTASGGAYTYDVSHLEDYARLAKTDGGFEEYIQRYVHGVRKHDEYLTLNGLDQKSEFNQSSTSERK